MRIAALATDRPRRLLIPAAAVWLVAVLVVQEYAQASEISRYRAQNSQLATAYSWIRQNTRSEDSFVADRDAMLFFHTGRRAERLHCSVRDERIFPGRCKQRLLALGQWARARGHRYVLLASGDFRLKKDVEMQLRAELARQAVVAFSESSIIVYDLGTETRRHPANTTPSGAL